MKTGGCPNPHQINDASGLPDGFESFLVIKEFCNEGLDWFREWIEIPNGFPAHRSYPTFSFSSSRINSIAISSSILARSHSLSQIRLSTPLRSLQFKTQKAALDLYDPIAIIRGEIAPTTSSPQTAWESGAKTASITGGNSSRNKRLLPIQLSLQMLHRLAHHLKLPLRTRPTILSRAVWAADRPWGLNIRLGFRL